MQDDKKISENKENIKSLRRKFNFQNTKEKLFFNLNPKFKSNRRENIKCENIENKKKSNSFDIYKLEIKKKKKSQNELNETQLIFFSLKFLGSEIFSEKIFKL
jgi:hypothetical protein